jgi:serine/threonine protein kinase
MAGRVDLAQNLRFGLSALESGRVPLETFLAALRAWAREPGQPLAAFLPEAVPSDAEATVAYQSPGGQSSGRPPSETLPAASSRFQLLRPHARGGLGEVWVARDRELNRTVALKILPESLLHDPSARARFHTEAEITGSLDHPGIVAVYSFGRFADERPFYAMHLIEGETLRAAIERYHQKPTESARGLSREPEFRRLLRSVVDACNAVAYAHSRAVIHRDLKPENIMLGPFGETWVVDWGLAKRTGGDDKNQPSESPAHAESRDPSLTLPGSVVGTPRYMSPEQAAGNSDRVDFRSDIYSLGAILYCVLSGQDPFGDGDIAGILTRVARGIFPAPRRVLSSIDPALEAICLKAMALDPGNRFASALELAGEIDAWLADVRYRGEQALALGQARTTLARLCLERAHSCFERETSAEGLLWLARALASSPPESPDLERVIRTSLAGWQAVGKQVERNLRHGSSVRGLDFCPESRRLATAGTDHNVKLWDLATGATLAPPLKHDGPVQTALFSSDGATLVTAAEDGTIRRFDGWTGEPVGAVLHFGTLSALALSPDGSTIAAVSDREGLALWSRDNNRRAHPQPNDFSRARTFAFAPDGSALAIALDDGLVWLCDPTTGASQGQPLNHQSTPRVLAFAANGQSLVAGCPTGEVILWDLASRTPAASVTQQGEIRSVAFRPGDLAFATLDSSATARLWESATGRPIGRPLAPEARAECLAFRPDGTMLATGNADGTVRLWCAMTALPIGPPLLHGAPVFTLKFSHDGRRLASGGADAVVRSWKLPAPIEGTPERIATWIGVTTELEFDPGDAVQRLDGAALWDLRRRLNELGGAPAR